jgi:predicted cupin superfamily sugar epimerase
MPSATAWIQRLGLSPHPEGGYYRELYRSSETVAAGCLPERFGGPRPFSTAIYFLLEGTQVSALHRIKSDEAWHFYAGSPLCIDAISAQGKHLRFKLGPDPTRGETFFQLVPAGCWFGARLVRPGPEAFALVGCTVAPGFDFADFELAERETLSSEYPQHRELIEAFTRTGG